MSLQKKDVTVYAKRSYAVKVNIIYKWFSLPKHYVNKINHLNLNTPYKQTHNFMYWHKRKRYTQAHIVL